MIRIAKKKPVEIEVVQWTGSNIDEIVEFDPDAIYSDGTLTIPTLEGDVTATVGSWIAKGVEGEFWPIKESIFQKTYDLVED